MICCHKIEPKYELPRQYNRVFHMFPSTIYTHFHSVFLSVTLIFWTKIKGSQLLLLGSSTTITFIFNFVISSNFNHFKNIFIIIIYILFNINCISKKIRLEIKDEIIIVKKNLILLILLIFISI